MMLAPATPEPPIDKQDGLRMRQRLLRRIVVAQLLYCCCYWLVVQASQPDPPDRACGDGGLFHEGFPAWMDHWTLRLQLSTERARRQWQNLNTLTPIPDSSDSLLSLLDEFSTAVAAGLEAVRRAYPVILGSLAGLLSVAEERALRRALTDIPKYRGQLSSLCHEFELDDPQGEPKKDLRALCWSVDSGPEFLWHLPPVNLVTARLPVGSLADPKVLTAGKHLVAFYFAAHRLACSLLHLQFRSQEDLSHPAEAMADAHLLTVLQLATLEHYLEALYRRWAFLRRISGVRRRRRLPPDNRLQCLRDLDLLLNPEAAIEGYLAEALPRALTLAPDLLVLAPELCQRAGYLSKFCSQALWNAPIEPAIPAAIRHARLRHYRHQWREESAHFDPDPAATIARDMQEIERAASAATILDERTEELYEASSEPNRPLQELQQELFEQLQQANHLILAVRLCAQVRRAVNVLYRPDMFGVDQRSQLILALLSALLTLEWCAWNLLQAWWQPDAISGRQCGIAALQTRLTYLTAHIDEVGEEAKYCPWYKPPVRPTWPSQQDCSPPPTQHHVPSLAVLRGILSRPPEAGIIQPPGPST